MPDNAAAGQRAIDLLKNRLPDVADFYGKSADEFKALLRSDHRMRIDKRGRLFVIDELEAPLSATQEPQQASGMLDGTLAPLDQTFLLHSRPGAKRTIYLNFKGATLTGTAWNGSSGSLTARPFDIDGVPGTFSTTELQRIQYIWQRVAEDFAPFDVNVTTEAVSLDRITRSGTTDDVYGTTVLITSRAGFYSCSCGGVAYVGVFDYTNDFYKPALVFYDALGNGNQKYVAEAISHEVGHNVGLGHDGTATAGYYRGHGSGATGWAPIMGVGYDRQLVQWSKGEYAGANNKQDDYVVMQSNGLPFRPDDHGNTAATATLMTSVLANGISTANAQGIVERPTDVDMFAFTASAGGATIKVTPAVRSANLDALVTVRDATGATLATVNPVDALNASATLALPAAGTYYVSVQGTGKGDPLTTGYSNYGSVGQYALSVSHDTAGNQPSTLIVNARATLLNNLGPVMTVLVDGVQVGQVEVRSATFADHQFTVPSLRAGSKVDVVFTNDGTGSGQDRNLFVAYVKAGETSLAPTAVGTTYDRGAGAKAFDGIDVIPGQSGMYWNGALRMTWPQVGLR